MVFGRKEKKRKRIPYDPPGSKSRIKANRAANKRLEQVFITRRALMFKGGVVGAFSVLLARLGYMQIGKGDDWAAQATTNRTDWRELKPARGLIVDRQGRVMAGNRKSWSVSVIPADIRLLPDESLAYVKEQLVTALRLPDVVMVNPGSIPADAKDQVYRRLGGILGDTTDQDFEDTRNWIKAQLQYNDYAKFDNISADVAAQIRTFRADLPGVEVVNLFDFVVRNYRYMETPFLLKSDITRDVAMKLASNQLYLPGVVLDDNVLTRKYEGGKTMSHILGFAGPITDEELNDDSNVVTRSDDGSVQYRYYRRDDIIGKQGLEYYYEEQLRGLKGGYLYERDANGRELRRLDEGAQPAVQGRNLRLTIDVELQAAVSRVLEQELPLAMERRVEADIRLNNPRRTHRTQGGAVVIMDVRNGEVLAMASYPTYDNTLFVEGISQRKYDELKDDPRGPLYDKCYMQKYFPGSIIKPFMALTGLREEVIDPGTEFNCGGGIQVPFDYDESKGNEYGCWNRNPGHGPLSLEGALIQSCDVYFYNIGVSAGQRRENGKVNHYFDFNTITRVQGAEHEFQGLGINKIHESLTKRFWFGRITGVDLPVETAGLIGSEEWIRETYNEGWSIGDTVNASIGQGYIEASPLQMAMNVAALANGGKIYKPRIVQGVVDNDGNVLQEFAPVVKRRAKVDKEHLRIVNEAMRKVVNDPAGTAHHNADGTSKWSFSNPDGEEPIIIAGKTGTAEFFKRTEEEPEGFYDQHAWFTMFAPFDDPEVAIVAFVESGGEGSTNAVPIVDKAYRAYLELTGKRPRGKVLRQDGQPISEKVPSPLDDPNAGKVDGAKPEATPESEP